MHRRGVLPPVLAILAAAFCLALCALAVTAIDAQAGPPAPVEIILTQPDGTTLTARLWGDERLNGLETTDGYTLLHDEASGYWVYARRQADGSLAPAQRGGRLLRAGIDPPGTLPQHLRPAPVLEDAAPLADRVSSNASLVADGVANPAGTSKPAGTANPDSALAANTGTQRLLVILVSFTDQAQRYPAATFRDLAFGASGSVRDYYLAASGGGLLFAPASESFASGPDGAANDGVVGWLPLPMAHPYIYAFSDETQPRSRGLARAALLAANPYVNFANFDANFDGYVTADELQILIVAAGCETSAGNCPFASQQVWAHHYSLEGHPLILDGRFVAMNGPWPQRPYGGYAMIGEWHNDPYFLPGELTPYPATLGPVVHELGHFFGWPDLYDQSSWENGVGRWSLMAHGGWNSAPGGKPGSLPGLPDAFLRWHQGWLTPSQAQPGQTYRLDSPADAPLLIGGNPYGVDWRYMRNSGTGEYWLLENRQAQGYDAGLPAGGLLLWHIAENTTAYRSAFKDGFFDVNYRHLLVTLEQADGRNDLEVWQNNFGDSGDPFPGSENNLAWNSQSRPNNFYHSQVSSGYALTFAPTGDPQGYQVTLTEEMQWPHQILLPVVMRQQVTGWVSYGNGSDPAPGHEVRLHYSEDGGDTYRLFEKATSNSAGGVTFSMPPMGRPHQAYYLSWQNTRGDNSLLASFYGNDATFLTRSHHHEILIGNIPLFSPQNTAVSSPATFLWRKRWNLMDNYQVVVTNQNLTKFYYSPELGYLEQVTLDLPSDLVIGQLYYWFVLVNTPDGTGFSYYMYPFSFSGVSANMLNTAPRTLWETSHDAEILNQVGLPALVK